MFKSTYEGITKGNPLWNQLSIPSSTLYSWDVNLTYIHEPPYFKDMSKDPPGPHGVKDAYCLLNVGDSITTDHSSPCGNIHKDSPTAKYLLKVGVELKDFNSYGSRRGNDEVMTRGTFANIRIVNKFLIGEVGSEDNPHSNRGETSCLRCSNGELHDVLNSLHLFIFIFSYCRRLRSAFICRSTRLLSRAPLCRLEQIMEAAALEIGLPRVQCYR